MFTAICATAGDRLLRRVLRPGIRTAATVAAAVVSLFDMSSRAAARRFLAPVGRPVRKWAIETRTRMWRDHSRLFVAGDGHDWAIADDARQIARLATRLGARVGS